MSPTTDSRQKEERPWPTVSRSTRPSRRYADSSEGIVRCVLYRAVVKLRACSGREGPEQPKSKLFAKLAVELFVLNLIRAFVGVCGHVVSALRVCGVFAMLDHSPAWFGVPLLAASISSMRLFWMSNRSMSPAMICLLTKLLESESNAAQSPFPPFLTRFLGIQV